jgi:hypothetical protein
MRLHKSHFSIFIIYAGFTEGVIAQFNTQVGLGSYGAVHSYYINPSLNAYSKNNWQINVAGFWANANNNYLTLQLPYSIYKVPNKVPEAYQTSSGNTVFMKSWLNETINSKSKFASVSLDVYGPSTYVKLGKSWNIGFVSNASAGVRINKLPENLAHAIYKELDSAQGAFSLFNKNGNNAIGPFSATGNSRVSAGINISKSFKQTWNRQILGGITIKKVWGMPGFYMNSSGLSATQISQDSLLVSPTSINLVTYGDKIGKGWGTDIGVTYLFHKKDYRRHGDYNKKHPDYYSKIGFSILDIGAIKYADAQYKSVNIPTTTGLNISKQYTGTTDYAKALDSFMSSFGTYTSSVRNAVIGLPTRVVINSDFQLKKHVFASGVISQSLRTKKSQNARYQNFVMLAPRLEYSFFEFSMPLLLEYDYRSLRMGASFRFGPVYFGTNSLASLVNTHHINDADIFAGIVISDLKEFSWKEKIKKYQKNTKKSKLKCFDF